MTLPSPKRGSTPASFYKDYLPQLWRALVGDEPVDVSDMAVAVVLRDGGQFATALHAGVLVSGEMKEVPAESPVATFDSDTASWRIALLDLLPRLLKHAEPRISRDVLRKRLAGLDVDAVRAAPGVITVIYEDDAGDKATVHISVGGGGKRRAVVEASDTELWKLLEGGGRLSQLVTSRVRVSGDIGYVLELARLLEN